MKYLEVGKNKKTEFQIKLHRKKSHVKEDISKEEL